MVVVVVVGRDVMVRRKASFAQVRSRVQVGAALGSGTIEELGASVRVGDYLV